MPSGPRIIHIVAGPTASGKSAYAAELAARINGVVVNCDSMQIYNALPILTAQPAEEERRTIPHRLYGVLEPNEICAAGRWREMAQSVIEDIFAREQTPIVTGGTGLYIKALMEGLSPMPEIPMDIRETAIQKQKELGNPGFHAELKTLDPEMAARLDPNDSQRLIRAWEVFKATGVSLAAWQRKARLAPPPEWRFEIRKIIPERAELRERINARFVKMLDSGALEEVRTFRNRVRNGEIPEIAPIRKAHGLRFLTRHLDGEISLDEAVALSQTETRQYAKRQITWLRHQF